MFEANQEIFMLHGGFLSARSRLNAQKSVQLQDFIGLSDNDIKLAVDIIQDTVGSVIKSYGSSLPEGMRTAHMAILDNIHTGLFYKVLNSCGITCAEADRFYESILSYFFPFDWKFYIRLISHSYFIEHFVQCVVQLPDEIISLLLQWSLKEIKSDSTIASPFLYSLLSILSRKSYSFPLSANSDSSEIHSRFDFDFKYIHDKSETQLEVVSAEVLSFMLHNCKEVNICGVLFSWLLSMMNSALQYTANFSEIIQSKLIHPFFIFAKDYVCGKAEPIGLFASSFPEFAQFICLKTPSVLYPAYTLFLMYHRWQDLRQGLEEDEVVKLIDQIVDQSYSSHPFRTNDASKLDYCIEMLMQLVEAKMDGELYAIEILLNYLEHPKRHDVICCLRKNVQAFSSNKSCLQHLRDAVVRDKDQTELIDLFLTVFKLMPQDDQYAFLQCHVREHGMSLILKSSSYKSDLNKFLMNMKIEKPIMHLGSLFIQSFEETLEKVIHHSINHKFTCDAVKALKSLSFMFSSCGEKQSLPLLINCLQHIIEDKLMENEQDNLFPLMQEFITVFDGSETFPLDQFFTTCIQPYLHMKSSPDHLMFSLRLLEVALRCSESQVSGSWLLNINVSALLVLLCSFISHSVASMNMGLKEQTVLVLSALSKLQQVNVSIKQHFDKAVDKKQMQHYLSTMHPAVQFYAWEFIESPDIDLQCLDLRRLLWRYVICQENYVDVRNEILHYRNHFGHASLAKSVAEIVPYLTAEEFPTLMDLLKEIPPPDSMQEAAARCKSSNVEISKSKLSALYAAEVFIDALILLKGCRAISFDWSHIISSFSHAVKVCLGTIHSCPVSLSKLFLEVCHLCSALEEEHDALNATLHDSLSMLRSFTADASIIKVCNIYVMAAKQNLNNN